MSVRPLKRLKQSWKNSLLWLTKPRLRNRKHQVIRYKIIDQPSSNLSSLRFLYHSFSRSFSSCKELYEKGKSVHRFDHKVPLSHAACYIFFYNPSDCHFDVLFVNPLHPNISMHILHTVLYTSLDKWLTRNNC